MIASLATRAALGGALALAPLSLWPQPAAAELAPLQIVSVGAGEQADAASTPAISADGRYVAFTARLAGRAGVFRRELGSGAVELVAGADAYGSPGTGVQDASAPSISADGRYVAFTTSAALDPARDPGSGSSVYVRDMTQPLPADGTCAADGPCAFELASALDGSRDGLRYETTAGSVATGRDSLSADGRRVAFVVVAPSDLTSGEGGSTPGVQTPGGQVVVRDLDSLRTTLVSSVRDPQTGAMTDRPVTDGAVRSTAAAGSYASRQLPGAAISADGTTVAWLGVHVGEQAPVLDGELGGGTVGYVEPLWRRIADGPLAPTRRIVGGGDPLAPGCPPGGTLDVPACRGPFPALRDNNSRTDPSQQPGWLSLYNGIVGVPQLSADGRTVALIGDPTVASNVFVVDMHDGLSRAQAVRQLTAAVPLASPIAIGLQENLAITGDVWDVALSADGRRLAYVSARTRSTLSPPVLVGPPLARAGLTELYRIDLDAETIERITSPAGGGPSSGPGSPWASGEGASSPSFSADGRTLAFASSGSNLVGGDANGASDVFVARDLVVSDEPGPLEISPPPPPRVQTPEWRMAVRAVSLRDGRVRLDASLPSAGRLRASARAQVSVRRVVRVRRRGHRPRRVVRTRDVKRTVATATRSVVRGGVTALPLRVNAAQRARTRARSGLRATVTVVFTGQGGRPLHDTLVVRFRARGGTKATSRPSGRAR